MEKKPETDWIWLDDEGVIRYANGPFVDAARVVGYTPDPKNAEPGEELRARLLEHYRDQGIAHPLNAHPD
jgi:hypothetical protein